MNLQAEIERLIAEMRKPRQVCVCGAFKASNQREMDFTKCANCKGWMSKLRIVSNEQAGG